MDYEEAKLQLKLHVGVLDEARKAMVLPDGFLPSLRPYRGLKERNFHQVMEALLAVGERIHREPTIDRDLIATVWSMCSYARLWGLQPDGMLQRNGLITGEDVDRLRRWVGKIEATTLSLLAGQPPYVAVYHYAEYVVEVGWGENFGFFIPLMVRAVSPPTVGDAMPMILRALGKMGRLATGTLPTLYEALHQEYSWNRPEFETRANRDGTTAHVRASIRETIDAIESAIV